jgi:hypothetical protein
MINMLFGTCVCMSFIFHAKLSLKDLLQYLKGL